MAASRVNLSTLQAGRGVAAILVVLFHLSATIFNTEKYYPGEIFGNFFDFGHAGVYYFFVLSGFIILHAHRKDLDQPSSLPRYAWSRLTRIYPAYWFVLAGLLAAYAVIPSLNTAPPNRLELLTSITLIGPHDRPPLAVSWTLFHELAFYGVFALAVMNKRLGMIFGALWGAACIASFFTPGKDFYLLEPVNLLFAFGLAARYLFDREVKQPLALGVIGAVVFVLIGLDDTYSHVLTPDWLAVTYGLASIAIVLGFAKAEMAGQVSAPGWLKLLGDASYSIYLVHYPALSLLAKVSVKVHLPPVVAFFFMAAASIALGIVFHMIVERPLLKLCKRVQFGAAAKPAPAAA